MWQIIYISSLYDDQEMQYEGQYKRCFNFFSSNPHNTLEKKKTITVGV